MNLAFAKRCREPIRGHMAIQVLEVLQLNLLVLSQLLCTAVKSLFKEHSVVDISS